MKTSLLSEQELIVLLKAKEKKGFDLLYSRYGKVLYTIILKTVHHPELAEDVLQDSFIKIWKCIEGYDASKGSLFTWILNIARNSAIDSTRSLYYRKEIYARSYEQNSLDRQPSIHLSVDGIGIKKHVEQLRQEHQQVIDCIYFQGYTHEQAAKHLHIPLGTAKSRVKAALHQLRLLLL